MMHQSKAGPLAVKAGTPHSRVTVRITLPHDASRLDNLQVLRAVAALMVTIAHAAIVAQSFGLPVAGGAAGFYITTAGAAGVDLFFVISGYIMARYAARYARTGPAVALQFAAERAARIYPPWWLALFLFWAVCSVALPGIVAAPGWDWWHSLSLFPDLHAPAGVWGLLLMVGWTLCFELYFYALVALGLAFSAAWRWLVPGAVVALVLAGPLLPGPWARWIGNPLALEFVLGWAIAFIPATVANREPWLPMAAGLLGVCAYLAGLSAGMSLQVEAPLILRGEAGWLRVVVWGLPAALCVLAAVQATSSGKRVWRPWVALGDASYSLYLIHMTVLIALGALQARAGWQSASASIIGGVVVVTLASVLFHRWVEKPAYTRLRDAIRGLGSHR